MSSTSTLTTGSIREEVFAEVNYHAGYEAMRCVRTRRHKLIKIHDDDLRRVSANVDDSPAKDALWELGWFDQPREPVQLYDVLLDPGERQNLAGSPRHVGIRAALEQRLDA